MTENYTLASQSTNIESLANSIKCAIDNKKKIILGGCGTSGRLGFFVTRKFNRLLKAQNYHPVFDYSLAGDDEAIFVSNEIVEDSPQMGAADLEAFKNVAAYVGITCGLSGKYVLLKVIFIIRKTRTRLTGVIE